MKYLLMLYSKSLTGHSHKYFLRYFQSLEIIISPEKLKNVEW